MLLIVVFETKRHIIKFGKIGWYNKIFIVSIILNTIFVLFEWVKDYYSGNTGQAIGVNLWLLIIFLFLPLVNIIMFPIVLIINSIKFSKHDR